MKTYLNTVLLAMVLSLSLFLWVSAAAGASTCVTVTPVNLGTPITAAVVATSGESITGNIDASGCDVGVFIPNTVSDVTVSATIHDANQYGVFADGGVYGEPNATSIAVQGSTVYDIGNHVNGVFSPNGVQTGFGVYFSAGVTGSITGNTIYNYQKGGIVVFYLTGPVTDNNVTGLGPVKFIAQNGIQLGYPQPGLFFPSSNVAGVAGNTVTGNVYTEGYTAGGDPFVATGILVYASSGNSGSLNAAIHTTNTVYGNQANVVVSVA
jgi:hypothetical protein